MKQSVHLQPCFPAPAAPSAATPLPAGGEALVRFHAVTKRYDTATGGELALRGVDLALPTGGLVAIVGKSGSGKSTLLNLLTAVDRPSDGEIEVAGVAVHALDETAGARWRRASVGIVFQFFQLLPALTVRENVLLPMALLGREPVQQREARAHGLLDRMGIADQAHKLPTALSGGQQQRCAIARALANDPPLLVADEPTGNLDSRTAESVLELLRQLADAGKTVVVVTHERDIGRLADRVVTLADGRIVSDEAGTRQLIAGGTSV
ncbi:MAG: ABC transporter ATP-binding protein [Opitutae bacterium]|nr:ABC transporter ATP-binding protein [Opitutae bacterium]